MLYYKFLKQDYYPTVHTPRIFQYPNVGIIHVHLYILDGLPVTLTR